MNILVTGGAGYIGSHAALALLEAGHAVTIIDDLSRGNRGAVDALTPLGDLHFIHADIGDRAAVTAALRSRNIELVMHFAALAYVGESVEQPLRYYRQNTAAAISLFEAMDDAGVAKLVFSSTCATYGEPNAEFIPINESCPQQPINPYGRSKLMVEKIILDYADMKKRAGEPFAAAMLRYFNVAGSDSKGRIGEDHKPETHLIPICLQAALSQRDGVTIFGTDYPTPDGTCVRDYVHVTDLIDAHVLAMQKLSAGEVIAMNVGIGKGASVREVVDACRAVTGVKFSVKEGPRRPGDPPMLYADPAKIRATLGFNARYIELNDTVRTAWEWMRAHPNGYRTHGDHAV
jgi:UDP-glucose 4-epimerase